MEAKAFSFTHRTKVFADGTVRKISRDPRRTRPVPGWHRDKRPYKRRAKWEATPGESSDGRIVPEAW